MTAITAAEAARRAAESARVRGLAGVRFTLDDMRSPALQKLLVAVREEQGDMRAQLEHPMNIEQTTLLRGRLQLVKEILARTDEVGPESRQSEPWPEAASFAHAAVGMPESGMNL